MALYGLKASTKDVDLVFDTRPDLKQFIQNKPLVLSDLDKLKGGR